MFYLIMISMVFLLYIRIRNKSNHWININILHKHKMSRHRNVRNLDLDDGEFT